MSTTEDLEVQVQNGENIVLMKLKFDVEAKRYSFTCIKCSNNASILKKTYRQASTPFKGMCVKCSREDGKKKSGAISSVDDFEQSLKEYGFILVSKEGYVNSKSKMNVVCSNGHISEKTFAGWNLITSSDSFAGGCRECINKGLTKTFEDVKKDFEKMDLKLTSTTYTNNKDPLEYICSCGRNGSGSYSNVIRQGHRCGSCNRVVEYDEILKTFEEARCKLITQRHEYINNVTPLKYICSCGKVYETSWKNFLRGDRCDVELSKKRQETVQQTYGVTNVMFNDDVKKAWKDGLIEKYGSFEKAMENTHKKSKATCLRKYGVEWVYHLDEHRTKGFKRKAFEMPNGHTLSCQGYEPFALRDLVNAGEKIIKTGNDVPSIKYTTHDGTERIYHPDIYLPESNTLIEVKSMYTLHSDIIVNILKIEAASRLYTTFVWVYNANGVKTNEFTLEDLKKYEINVDNDCDSDMLNIVLTKNDYDILNEKNIDDLTYSSRFKQMILKRGYYYVSPFEYTSAKIPMGIICNKGHIFFKSCEDFRSSNTCICCIEMGRMKKLFNEFAERAKICDLTLLNIDKKKDSSRNLAILQCNKCANVFEITGEALFTRQTQWCEDCSRTKKEKIN